MILTYSNLLNQLKLGIKLKKKFIFIKNNNKHLVLLNKLIQQNVINGYSFVNNNKNINVYLNNNYDYFKIKNFFKKTRLICIKYKHYVKLQSKMTSSIYLFSTSQGLLTSKELLQKKTGGILMCKLF